MPRTAKELSALDVKRLRHEGVGRNVTFPVGGVSGLLLQITPNQGRSWLLRTTVGTKRREIGLGSFPEVTLAQARDKARDVKEQIRRGLDPIIERKAARSRLITAQRRSISFKESVDRYLDAKMEAHSNEKHRQQWHNTLAAHAVPVLGDMLVDDIDVHDIFRTLEPIWMKTTETASRLRGRIESVLSWATVAGHRSGDNPARWKGNLSELLPAPNKVKKGGNHPALQINDAPRWFVDLRSRKGVGSRALEFTVLTACRSQEVRCATWDEIDIDLAIWTIPAVRMKAEREHRIPLPTQAIELLKNLPQLQDNPFVFPGARGGELSDMTLSNTMKRMHESDLAAGRKGFFDRISKRPAVPHGLRSTFRDWAAERTEFPREMAELALSHKVGNAVEAAYRRGDMIEKRRVMMDAWSRFIFSEL